MKVSCYFGWMNAEADRAPGKARQAKRIRVLQVHRPERAPVASKDAFVWRWNRDIVL